ncbi:NUDIX domain-containing protein [Hufsiella ginkgonis]|uniref:GDP-mannose pyrophosphatase n=1 Tax=Hufsiella ginkgonis TaxID=2695274 RepID=A0A7K1XSA4_9SPHI|nr:NUDIX domain-containing protein [Hufsiella ginkgonis]MXV13834.1 NUDIX domain-containing protein [Hufsiella ginkgonis]
MAIIRLHSRKTLSNERYPLETIECEYNTKDGRTVQKTVEVYQRPSACAILLYNPEQKTVVLSEQVRIATWCNGNPGGSVIEACAGLIDEGETPEEAVIREVEEELGYRIGEVEEIGKAYSSPGGNSELIYYFLGKYSPGQKVSAGGGAEGEEENITILEWSYQEAIGKLKSGEIQDAKTIILLQYAMLNEIISA